MSEFGREVSQILILILVIGFIAVLVSKNAKTTSAIQVAGNFVAMLINQIMAPVGGAK